MDMTEIIELVVFCIVFFSIIIILRKTFPEVDFDAKLKDSEDRKKYKANNRKAVTLLVMGVVVSFFIKDAIVWLLKKYILE